MFVNNEILTLQTYKWCTATKTGQIMLLETPLHLGIDVRFGVIVLIRVVQLHLDVTLELVIFGEYCYYRDFKTLMSIPVHKVAF